MEVTSLYEGENVHVQKFMYHSETGPKEMEYVTLGGNGERPRFLRRNLKSYLRFKDGEKLCIDLNSPQSSDKKKKSAWEKIENHSRFTMGNVKRIKKTSNLEADESVRREAASSNVDNRISEFRAAEPNVRVGIVAPEQNLNTSQFLGDNEETARRDNEANQETARKDGGQAINKTPMEAGWQKQVRRPKKNEGQSAAEKTAQKETIADVMPDQASQVGKNTNKGKDKVPFLPFVPKKKLPVVSDSAPGGLDYCLTGSKSRRLEDEIRGDLGYQAVFMPAPGQIPYSPAGGTPPVTTPTIVHHQPSRSSLSEPVRSHGTKKSTRLLKQKQFKFKNTKDDPINLTED